MTRSGVALLDVNVLIALSWPNHVHHSVAQRWFARHHSQGWATTPVTEMGFVRISSNRAAIPTATTPELALTLLRSMTEIQGHEFWPDEVRFVLGDSIDAALIGSYRNLTDAHLLAVAEQQGGRLVTFDAAIRGLVGLRNADVLEVVAP